MPDHAVGCYRHEFTLPSSWDGRRIRLTFDGVCSAFTVWVNAGSFRNGSFEHHPFADHTYPGCASIPRAWNHFFAPNAKYEVIQQYDWKYGFRNYGLRLRQVVPSSGNPFGGFVLQDVTGLAPNTEYVVSGWLGLDTWPDQNVTLPDGSRV